MAADRDDDDTPPWQMFMWMGILCGVALGAVTVVLLMQRRQNGQQLSGPINIWNVTGGNPQLPQPAMMQLPQASYPSVPDAPDYSADPGLKNKMSTVTLSPTSSNRLLRASGGRRWTVQVRTVGPPGAYAMFALDPDGLRGAEAGANSIVVPAGGDHWIELEPGDYLFGRGSTAGVVVSYTARQLA